MGTQGAFFCASCNTCRASSRVGQRTKNRGLETVDLGALIIGKRKANVFPVPVPNIISDIKAKSIQMK
jgi:hypothetical protein